MNTSFLPFSLPEIDEDEIAEVVDSLQSGWVTTGPKAKRFEESFATYLGGAVETVAVNSATAGLHLALEAVGVSVGDEVIVPTYTFTSTAEVVRYLGATPVFADSDPETFCVNPTDIERKITARTKAVMPVHFAGLACRMDEIIALAKKRGLAVVEDAAHAFPTRYRGSLIGTLETDATVFSFYANKTMTTGEGGMLVTRRPEIAARARVMRLHGISRDAFDRYRSEKPAWQYKVVEPGFKYNLTDIAAAIGLHQLRKIDRFQEKRERLAARYDEALADLPILLPPRGDGARGDRHAWHIYPLRLTAEAGIGRDEFIVRMAERKIGCSVHFIPLHRHPIWRDTYALAPEQFPAAERLFEGEVSIPLFSKMTADDQDRVIEAIRAILPADCRVAEG